MPDRERALQMEGRGFTTRVLMLANSKEAAEFRAGEISNSTYCFPHHLCEQVVQGVQRPPGALVIAFLASGQDCSGLLEFLCLAAAARPINRHSKSHPNDYPPLAIAVPSLPPDD